MNYSVIEEDTQTEIFGVYHVCPWEKFDETTTGQEGGENIDNRSEELIKPAIMVAIQEYTKETSQYENEESTLLHLIWAGDMRGNETKRGIQREQLLYNSIQDEMGRLKIKQALFTNFYMLKHRVISQETYDKIYDDNEYGILRTINTRPYNELLVPPGFMRRPDADVTDPHFQVDLSKSIGDEIEDFNSRFAEGKLTSEDLGRIKQERSVIFSIPFSDITFEPSIKVLFFVPKLSSKQKKRINLSTYDDKYIRLFF